MVVILLQVVLCVSDASYPVIQAADQITFHMGWMVGLEVHVVVGVGELSVDRVLRNGSTSSFSALTVSWMESCTLSK